MWIRIHRHRGINKVLRLLLLTNGFVLLASAMLGPIYALFVEDIGGDLLDASFAGTLFALAGGVTVLLSGKYADRMKRPEYVMAAGYLILTFGFFSYLFAQTIWHILIIQAILGFGEAVYSPAYNAIYSRHLDKHHEAAEWGDWEAMAYFVYAGGAIAGGYVATFLSFQGLFIIMTGFCLLSSVIILAMPRSFYQ